MQSHIGDGANEEVYSIISKEVHWYLELARASQNFNLCATVTVRRGGSKVAVQQFKDTPTSGTP